MQLLAYLLWQSSEKRPGSQWSDTPFISSFNRYSWAWMRQKWSWLTGADYTCSNISFHMLFLQSVLNILSMEVLPLEHTLTDYNGSDAMWLIRLDDKNAMHFHLGLLGWTLLRVWLSYWGTPHLAHEERPHGKVTRHGTKGDTFPTVPCLKSWLTELWA